MRDDDSNQQSDRSPESDSPTGDQERGEFLWYFTKDRQRIYAFIFSMLPNSTDAEDVFQQTSIVLWKKFDSFDKSRDFFAWACGIAYRDVKNFRKLSKRSKLFYNDDLVRAIAQKQLASTAGGRQSLDLLDECIAHLSEGDRQLVVHIYRDELAVSDIAKTLKRANQTIYNRLNIIRNGLLDCINRKRAARAGT